MKRFLLFVMMFGEVAIGQSGVQRLDERILEQLAASRTPAETAVALWISKANNYVNAGVPLGLLAAGLIRNDVPMKQNALYMASSTAVSYLLDYAIKQLVKRPRPFLTDLKLVPVYRPGEYSFPSGHTSSTFGMTTALWHAYPKWWVIAPSVLWSTSVGYSRMYLGVHYPTDVLGGAALGVGSALGLGFMRR
jgi:undecaprenyl-diphosphatase